MEETFLPRLLLIAGTGRNSGKTTFARKVIGHFSKAHAIVALKISSHFHTDTGNGHILVNRPNLFISEETDLNNEKDSTLLLKAGARKSYFIMADDEHLPEALNYVTEHIQPNDMLVCESGGLRKYFKPGVFLMFQGTFNKSPKPGTESQMALCDAFILFDGEGFNFDFNRLHINNNQWILK